MIQRFLNSTQKFQWLPPLLTRIALGVVFALAGWGKLQHIEKVVGYFGSLNIPFPSFQAPFVAGCELAFGVLILLGLFTRLASIPLIGIMIVAIGTAKLEDMGTLSDLFAFSEFLYVLLFLYLIVHGPGAVSVDCFLRKRLSKK